MEGYTTKELFQIARERLDIRTCGSHYGLTLDRHGKALCPFHDDHHPSMSFKGQYFKCFACGEGGDVFKLVGQLTGISKPIDVLKLLNDDFGLGLPVDTKLSPQKRKELAAKAREREHYAELEKKFAEWSNKAFIVMNRYCKLLRQWRTEYAPKSLEGLEKAQTQEKSSGTDMLSAELPAGAPRSDEELHPLFTESLQKLSEIEYITQQLISADRNAMQEFYLVYGKEVARIRDRIMFEDEGVPTQDRKEAERIEQRIKEFS